jgi:predicted site-specific integrase-resolvase
MAKRSGITEKEPAQGTSNPMSPRLLPLKEAAAVLGLSVWSLREVVWAGHLPVVRFPHGRKLFVDVQDIDVFITQNKTTFV